MILQSDTKRDIVLGAIAALGIIWLFMALVVMPLGERSDTLDRKIDKGRKDLLVVSAFANEYKKKSAALPKSQIGKRALPLLAEVQKIVASLGADKYIKRITPLPAKSRRTREGLSINIADMPLDLFVNFMQRLYESPSVINIMRANVKTAYGDRGRMSAELTLSPAV